MKLSNKMEWLPLYVHKLRSSPRYQAMRDYEQAWYLNLLFASWDSDRPGYLLDDGQLWRLANAHDKSYFEERKQQVMACFERTSVDGVQWWIFNPRMLEVLLEQHDWVTGNIHAGGNDDNTCYLYPPDFVSKKKRKVFSPPALGEVMSYCHERQKGVDPQQWFDYYTSNGWKVGRNSMKDWRASVRTWERNNHSGIGRQNKAEQRTCENLESGERAKAILARRPTQPVS